jgi:hypothetical protein
LKRSLRKGRRILLRTGQWLEPDPPKS